MYNDSSVFYPKFPQSQYYLYSSREDVWSPYVAWTMDHGSMCIEIKVFVSLLFVLLVLKNSFRSFSTTEREEPFDFSNVVPRGMD